jgi:hypothetical protein
VEGRAGALDAEGGEGPRGDELMVYSRRVSMEISVALLLGCRATRGRVSTGARGRCERARGVNASMHRLHRPLDTPETSHLLLDSYVPTRRPQVGLHSWSMRKPHNTPFLTLPSPSHPRTYSRAHIPTPTAIKRDTQCIASGDTTEIACVPPLHSRL